MEAIGSSTSSGRALVVTGGSDGHGGVGRVHHALSHPPMLRFTSRICTNNINKKNEAIFWAEGIVPMIRSGPPWLEPTHSPVRRHDIFLLAL